MNKHRSLQQRSVPRRSRRGAALFIVTMFIVAVGVLALTAIITTGNATLIAKSYARENDLRYSAEAALAIGKSRLNFDAAALPETGYVVLMQDALLMSADNQTIPGVKVTVYAGPSGSVSGQHGRFASVVAEARDNQGNGFIRRLELTQESFAKYAYWSADESPGGSTIYFGAGDQLWGPVWSNDVISIAASGATFHDDVATAKTISGKSNGVFKKTVKENQKPITLPSTTDLDANLLGFAQASGWDFDAPTTGDETTVLMRIEFVAIDLNADGDSLDADEGFFRIYKATTGNARWLRGDWTDEPSASELTTCGDFHFGRFYPGAIHNTTWFRDLMDTLPGGMTTAQADAEKIASATTIMNKAGSRCYLGGAPQLAPYARTTPTWTNAQIRNGGDETTFSPVDRNGAWLLAYTSPDTAPTIVKTKRPWDYLYLFPISRTMNTVAKGVLHSDGTIGVSGVLRGKITVYSKRTIVILDDLRYTNDPGVTLGSGLCPDIMGLLAAYNIVVADNALQTPPKVKWSSGDVYKNLDDTKDVYIHGVIMALNTSFNVQNHDQGPTDVNDCEGVNKGRGCLYLSGGLIQKERGPVALLGNSSGGTGFIKRYSYDRCALISPPPYFPTTGRFTDNRYYELNPVGFNALAYYQSITVDQ